MSVLVLLALNYRVGQVLIGMVIELKGILMQYWQAAVLM